jgi:hypothetical protein
MRAHPGRARPAFPLVFLAAASALLALSISPQLFWLFLVFGWLFLPALGALYRGAAAIPGRRLVAPNRLSKDPETELLRALAEHGELTPARAALATSLSVAEADRMLSGLAKGGHLEVKVRGGSLSYALPPASTSTEGGEAERR